MKLSSPSFADGEKIPDDFAFCLPDPTRHACLGRNLNPPLAWSEVPANAQSFVLICCDPDVPSVGDDVNQEGRTVPADLPRVDFFHWVLLDLPAERRAIAAGEFSSAVVAHGKHGPQAPGDTRQGINDYTGWFAADHDMRGDYYGYDGPCPPWNDEIAHRYVFTLYALDVAQLPVAEKITGTLVREALPGHVLAEARLTGWYSLDSSTP